MVAKVLLATVELLAIEVVGEIMGEAGLHGEVAIFMVASPGVVHPARILPEVIEDSSS